MSTTRLSAGFPRRTLLARTAALALPALTLAQKPSSAPAKFPGLITRQKNPVNLESPPGALASFLTSAEAFYVRCHFDVPQLRPESHQIRVEGEVKDSFVISYDELRSLPSRTIPATLECAGNSRVFLVPQQRGVQWELGAVGTAEWTGVPLSALLERAGVNDGAVEVILEGADQGEPASDPKPPGKIAFARSVPLAKALRPEVLLAYRMNGQDLNPEHGFPVRAVVPGFYGMSSVKWLTGIRVVRERFQGYWQTTDYAYWGQTMGHPVRRPLHEMRIKSAITRPAAREMVRAGQPALVNGAAWTGDSDIRRVEISTDGGQNWAEARLLEPVHRFAWRRWEYEWRVPSRPGRAILMSRATDAVGSMQPDKPDPRFGSYAIHHILPVDVTIA